MNWLPPSASTETLKLPDRPGVKSYAPRMGYKCWRCDCQHNSPEEKQLCQQWYEQTKPR